MSLVSHHSERLVLLFRGLGRLGPGSTSVAAELSYIDGKDAAHHAADAHLRFTLWSNSDA